MSAAQKREKLFLISHPMGDRFIPSSSSALVYKSNNDYDAKRRNNCTQLSCDTEMAIQFNPLFVATGRFTSQRGQNEASLNTTESIAEPFLPSKEERKTQDPIANALGYRNKSKVFNYQSPTKDKGRSRSASNSSSFSSNSDSNSRLIEIAGPLLSSASSKEVMKYLAQDKEPKDVSTNKNSKPPRLIVANSILQAPGLRNDFYSNLVSWSKKTNKIAVGLGAHVYSWGIDNDVEAIEYNYYDIVTAVAHSNDKFLVIATSHGRILLVDHLENQLLASYTNENKCVYCFAWFTPSRFFLAGDEFGDISIFEIVIDEIGASLTLRSSFKCHEQQVCGIALNNDYSQVAVGSNDNCCSIWDISDIDAPSLRFVLPHTAAVKAISFCPWTKSLLATGGGSRDRHIRFWHTKSGTLLSTHNTNCQVTSLVWSRFKKQLVATFGFGDGRERCLIKVFSYPLMCPVIEVPAGPNLRVLSSTLSPDGCSICVATNDSTVRIYRLWDNTLELVSSPQTCERGIYGSALIELHEDIEARGDTIR